MSPTVASGHPSVSFKGAAATQAVPICKTRIPPQPPFLTESGMVFLPEAAAPDFWLLLRSKPYLIFPLPLQEAVHHLQTFHNRNVMNKKGKHPASTWRGVGWFSYIIEYLVVIRTVFHCSS